MQEIADILKISKSSAENYLYQLDYVNHFDVWAPQKLGKKKPFLTISACDSLLNCNENSLLVKQIVLGDEK